MHQLYVLYEHSSGFAIFRTTEFEEIAVFLPQVRESVLNVSKFRSNVFFVTFQSFKEQKEALHNMQSLNSGELSNDLQLFLENNIPRSKKKKQPVVLGVADPDLALVISDKLGIKCISSGVVLEIIRGIRCHFYKLVKGFNHEGFGPKSQLSLAHHYSRKKLNFDATRQDCMIIETNKLLDQLEKDINTLGKRIREVYSFHFPELFRVIPHNTELYVQCINVIGDRKNITEDVKEKLSAVIEDPSKVENILYSAHNSMGTEISSMDLDNLKMLCDRVTALISRRESSKAYLESKMRHIAPNMSTLVGEMTASKLITRAGGLEKLARLTASSLLVIGAEKTLFRNLKGNAPISSLFEKSALVGLSNKKTKGKIARALANKCSLAIRMDCFSKSRTDKFGLKFRDEVKDRMKFLKNVKICDDSPVKNKKTSEEAMPGKQKSAALEKAKKILNTLDMETNVENFFNSCIETNILKKKQDNIKITKKRNFKEEEAIENKANETLESSFFENDRVEQVKAKKKRLSGKGKSKIIQDDADIDVDKEAFADKEMNNSAEPINLEKSVDDINESLNSTLKTSQSKKSNKRKKSGTPRSAKVAKRKIGGKKKPFSKK